MFKSILLIALFSMLINCGEKPHKVEKIGRIDALVIYYSLSDGEGTYAAADQLFEELIGTPEEWYRAMSKDTISFNRYQLDLENIVFSLDISSITKEELESSRKQAIDRLSNANVSTEFDKMNDLMIKRLKEIRPK